MVSDQDLAAKFYGGTSMPTGSATPAPTHTDRESQLAERLYGSTTPTPAPAPAGDPMARLYPNSRHATAVQPVQHDAPKPVQPVQNAQNAQPEVQPEHGFRTTDTEGNPFDGETLTAYAGVVRDLGVAPDLAQKVFDRMAPVLRERQVAQTAAIVEQWTEQVRNDPEIGGDALDENLRLANSLVRQHGTPELGELLRSGVGNAPELVRLLVRIAKGR